MADSDLANSGNSLRIADAEEMLRFGSNVAHALADDARKSLQVLLLYGNLGTGKTTFARGFVSALPGSANAEVASPSFTLCNIYPTTPPVLHFDLYRAAGEETLLKSMPEDLEEAFFAEKGFLLVEWSERLPETAKPNARIDVFFRMDNTARIVVMQNFPAAPLQVLLAAQAAEV